MPNLFFPQLKFKLLNFLLDHVYKKRVAKNTVDEELRKEGRVPL